MIRVPKVKLTDITHNNKHEWVDYKGRQFMHRSRIGWHLSPSGNRHVDYAAHSAIVSMGTFKMASEMRHEIGLILEQRGQVKKEK